MLYSFNSDLTYFVKTVLSKVTINLTGAQFSNFLFYFFLISFDFSVAVGTVDLPRLKYSYLGYFQLPTDYCCVKGTRGL